MKILIAMDSFKGSCSSLDAGNAIAEGVRRIDPLANLTVVPIADGGEGTGAVLALALGGTAHFVSVLDPLGRAIRAPFYVLPNATAVVELAAASGLTLLTETERNPEITSTFGTGQLIRAALDHGARKLIIGLGGSATNDGGTGLASALGVRFLDEGGNELPSGGAALLRLCRIDLEQVDARLQDTEILVACDVDNPLLGLRGASAIFGPQKGAAAEQVQRLDAALARYHRVLLETLQLDLKDLPGAGAAGGTTMALLAFTKATMQPGIDVVLNTLQFEEMLAGTDLVISGEGRIDAQTLHGKVIMGIAKRTKKQGVPLLALAGSIGSGTESLYEQGVTAMFPIAPGPITLQESMQRSQELLADTAQRCLRLILGILGTVLSP